MGIVFFCQSCGARFEVDPRMAGKKGRCKKCGQFMEIPRAEQIASMAAMPALAMAGAGVGAGAAVTPRAPVGDGAPSLSSWLKAAVSNVGLAPVSVDRMPIGMRRGAAVSPLDDAEDSKPYILAGPAPGVHRGKGTTAANAAVRTWRRELGVVERVFRWLSESAYFVSVPFIVLLLLGIALKSRNLALFAATFVVLLNIGRMVAGAANLVAVPLRDGIGTKSKRLKKPLRRVIEPVVTIGLVVLAFTFIPWLSAGETKGEPLTQRLRDTAKGLRKEMAGELESTVDQAKNLDVEKLGAEAREKLRTIGTGPDGAGAVPPTGATGPSSKDAIGGLIKDVGKRVRETVNESQKQP
jgi:hypothetical protein